MIDGVIFDCDGVLFDTARANEIYYNTLRQAVGLPELTEEEARFAHSATVEQAFNELTPVDKIPALMELSKTLPYLETSLPHITMDSHLKPLLILLEEQKKRIGIFTNRTRKGVIEIIEHFGIRHYFSDIVTCSEVMPKPSPKGLLLLEETWSIPLERLLFIGDTMADYGAAVSTSVQFVAFGNASLPTKRHVESFSEIIPMIGE